MAVAVDFGTYDEVIIKLHSLCNLACSYCYVYQMADSSWERNPKEMSREVAARLAARLAEHAQRYALPRVRVILHGGEPLLASQGSIRHLVNGCRRQITQATHGATQLDVLMQTNGVLLDRPGVLDMLAELGIRVGVSLDGVKSDHDRVRRTLPTRAHPQGLPTYDKVRTNISLMRQHSPGMLSVVLCVINPRSDPVATHDCLVALEPPRIDYLWPLGTHDSPPPGLGDGRTPYADWLIAVWKHHIALPGDPPRVRYFDELVRQLRTGWNPLEVIGNPVRGALMVDTAGNYNMGDAGMSVADGLVAMRWRTTHPELKSVRLGRGTRMGLHNATIHDAAVTAMEVNRLLGVKAARPDGPLLCHACMECPFRSPCGGGYYVNRWRDGSAYWNPSVYCADLKKIIAFAEQVCYYAGTLEDIQRDPPAARVSRVLRQRLSQLAGAG